MQSLFEAERHEPLTSAPWSEAAARSCIQRIAAAAQAEFDAASGFWPTHALDDERMPRRRFADLYFGSAGVFWALRDLASQGALSTTIDARPWLPLLAERTRESLLGDQHGTASYLCGESGVLLLHWSFTREPALADALLAIVQGNLHNSAREPLWGNSGTLLAAIHMVEATGEMRWMRLVQEGVAVLLGEMEIEPDTGTWIWVQDLYGRRTRYLGAGHGFAGNVYPVLRAAAMLDEITVATFVDRALQTLNKTAIRETDGERERINWHAYSDAESIATALARGKHPLVQDCHGAPGIVCRLATVPRAPEWDALLRGAGELTWAAGPLTKGASLCHGTGGSAMTMLKLWRRFGEPLWLERARLLAMYMIEQIERHRVLNGQGRHTLWTGDLGAACVLWNCIAGGDRFPTLDHF